jgi:histidinol-phosphate phosphatase family protein
VKRAVFLDRDGTLNREVGYIGDPADLELVPGMPAALARLTAAGFALVVITNQSAIGRGLYTRAQVDAVHARLAAELAAAGVRLDGIFVCPHAPDDGCDCRKPAPGLFLQARDALGIDLAASWMVGDTVKDMAAARAAGVRPVYVTTGWGERDRAAALAAGLPPDDVVPDLAAAAARILALSAPGG